MKAIITIGGLGLGGTLGWYVAFPSSQPRSPFLGIAVWGAALLLAFLVEVVWLTSPQWNPYLLRLNNTVIRETMRKLVIRVPVPDATLRLVRLEVVSKLAWLSWPIYKLADTCDLVWPMVPDRAHDRLYVATVSTKHVMVVYGVYGRAHDLAYVAARWGFGAAERKAILPRACISTILRAVAAAAAAAEWHDSEVTILCLGLSVNPSDDKCLEALARAYKTRGDLGGAMRCYAKLADAGYAYEAVLCASP
jgi:hypothetical protein